MLLISDRNKIKENILNIMENGEILISSQRYDELLSYVIELLSYFDNGNKESNLYRFFDLLKDTLFILTFKNGGYDATDLLMTAIEFLKSYEEMIEELNFEDIDIDTYILQSAKHSIFTQKERIESLNILNLLDKNRLRYFLTHNDNNVKVFTDLKDSNKIDLIVAPCNKKIVKIVRDRSNKPIALLCEDNERDELSEFKNIYYISNKSDDDEFFEELIQILNIYQCEYIREKTTNFKIKPLSKTIEELKNLDKDVSLREISSIISKDIALSTSLVEYVNKPFFGVVKEISSVNQAITFLGKEKTLAFAFNYGVKDSLGIDLSFYGLDEEKFNKINFLRSQLATLWYKKVSFSEYIIISSAAMLGAIGKIYLNQILKEMDKINQEKFKTYVKFDRLFAEDDILEISSEKISAMLLNKWGFSSELTNSIYYANDIESSPHESKHLAIANNAIFNTFDIDDNINIKRVKNIADFLKEMNFDETLYLKAIEQMKGYNNGDSICSN